MSPPQLQPPGHVNIQIAPARKGDGDPLVAQEEMDAQFSLCLPARWHT